MRSIDIHAHVTPQCFWRATEDGGDWHTLKREKDANGGEIAIVGKTRQPLPPKARSKRYHLPNSIGNLVDRAVTKNLERLLGL